MGKVIGIDLGTTMSAMAIVKDLGRPEMIPNREGKNLTPSAILIRGEERVVGERAKRAAVAKPENVFQFVKRRLCDPEFVYYDEDDRTHSPVELSALILKKLKQDAEEALGEEVTEAVITVPAYFADLERNRTRQAGEIAGLKVLDIINEPTAAAIAYGLGKTETGKTILVYDLGGGTFDGTVMKIVGPEELQVLTSSGDRFLGGADFDAELSTDFVQQFERKHGVDFKKIGDLKTDQDFRDKAELAKIDLSADTQVDVSLTAAGKILDLTLKRTDFEALIKHRIELTRSLTEEALQAAKLEWTQIDKVLLVGGSTRIPMVREMIIQLTGRTPETGINPDEVVAMGAALHAASRSGIVVRNEKGQMLPPVRLRDVTAHSLGIVVLDYAKGEINSIIIEKDSEIPVEKTKKGYSTIQDNQTAVNLTVLQGDDENPSECIQVGKAILEGIPAMPKGQPKIDVTLGYDASGMVHLHAKELTSGREISVDLKCPGLMSESDVKKNAERVGGLKVT